MKRLILTRLEKNEDRVLGRLLIFSGLDLIGNFATLEPPWKNNEKGKSCILGGYYIVEPRKSEKFAKHLIVNQVLNRDYILIHSGNYPKDTSGCILVGEKFDDIDGDGLAEVVNSKKALKLLLSLVTEKAELIIL